MTYTVGIDIGGTFTDTVVMDEAGAIQTYKSPTTPRDLIGGLLANVDLAAPDLLPQTTRIAHGTTAATNAYIERRGAKVALLATRGFEAVIFQQRMMGMTAGLSVSELTDYSKRRVPQPLAPPRLVFGIRERVDYRGEAIGRLREEDVRAAAERCAEEGVEALAIAFLWSFKNPAHERRAAAIAREVLPDAYVSLSSEVAPRIGEYERTATTLVNAYLGPTVDRYARTLEQRLGERGSRAQVVLLDSAGGVMTAGEAGRQPVRLLLSGPSGGLTASEYLGRLLGHRNVITFDMGGTSTDVGLIVDGVPLRRHEAVMEKYHLVVPMADIRAIGAGGGSIARVERGGYLRVGPESAGAEPGPACYGRGGVLPTVTDADLVLGILDPARFLGGRLPLGVAAAEAAVDEHVARPLDLSVVDAAAGIKRIVDARMADLLRTVTIQRGHDPRRFVLYAFGGAGPTHAPAFALDLVETLVVPQTQSVHSALGAIASDLAFSYELSEPMRLSRDRGAADADLARIERIYDDLERRAHADLAAHRATGHRVERFVDMRFTRQTKELRVPFTGTVPVTEFLRRYGRRYGEESVPDVTGFELVTFAVEARARLPRPELRRHEPEGPDAAPALLGEREAWDAAAGALVRTRIYEGERLRPGNVVRGPAIVEYAGTTVAVSSGQEMTVDELLNLTVRRA